MSNNYENDSQNFESGIISLSKINIAWQETIGELLAEAKANPDNELRILVLDDNPEEVKNLLQILKAWPKISPVFVEVRDQNTIDTIKEGTNYQIALLDENLGEELKGTTVFGQLSNNNPQAKFFSISGGKTPQWARSRGHFEDKNNLLTLANSNAFVTLINEGITALEFSS